MEIKLELIRPSLVEASESDPLEWRRGEKVIAGAPMTRSGSIDEVNVDVGMDADEVIDRNGWWLGMVGS